MGKFESKAAGKIEKKVSDQVDSEALREANIGLSSFLDDVIL